MENKLPLEQAKHKDISGGTEECKDSDEMSREMSGCEIGGKKVYRYFLQQIQITRVKFGKEVSLSHAFSLLEFRDQIWWNAEVANYAQVFISEKSKFENKTHVNHYRRKSCWTKIMLTLWRETLIGHMQTIP